MNDCVFACHSGFHSQLLSPVYVAYMNWWYEDPDAPETTL